MWGVSPDSRHARYIVVLSILFVLSLLGFGIMHIAIMSQKTSSAEINLSSRQRMLSQRIVFLQGEYTHIFMPIKKETLLELINESVEEMKVAHKALTMGHEGFGVAKPGSKIQELYFGSTRNIDSLVQDFLNRSTNHIRKLLAGQAIYDEWYTYANYDVDSFLESLDLVVDQYQKESEAKINDLQFYQILILLTSSFVLLLSGFFVFRPMVNRTRKNFSELQNEEERFHSIINSSVTAMIVAVDDEGMVVTWNPAAEKSFGYKTEEILNKPLTMIIPDRYMDAHNSGFRRALKEDHGDILINSIEVYGLHKDGYEFPIELSIGSWNKDGKKHFTSIIHDVSERKNSEEINTRLGKIIEQSLNEVLLFSSENFKFLYVNQSGLENLGYTAGEMQHMTPSDICVDFPTQSDLEEFLKPLTTGEVERLAFEAMQRRKNGSEYEIFVSFQLMKNETPPFYIAFINDITEQKVLERSLQRAQKMETVGQLTGGIAHDFNNILGVVQGNLEILQRIVPDEVALGRIEKALKGIKRGAVITNKLLGFSRQESHGSQIININQLLQNMEDLIAKSAAVAIRVENYFADDLWPVAVVSGDLEDAILNLSLNARDAMPDGGTLRIETMNKVLDDRYVLQNPESKAGEHVLVSVSDTGIGMSKKISERAFDPFFTTKEDGKGTGLGLSMVYGFVKRSGGHIQISSESGKGSTFNIYLPRAQEMPAANTTPSDSQNSIPLGTEKILVVDDDAELVDVAVTHLEELGYKTLKAYDGEQALQVLRDNPDVDLLFNDIIMPNGMDGYQLALVAKKKYPSLSILLTSGFTKHREQYIDHEALDEVRLAGNLLNKPYNRSELAMRIRETLDEDQ